MSKWSNRWDLRKAGLGNALLSHNKHRQFMSVITKAERGYGKSMYNLQSIAYAYYHMGFDEQNAWEKALDCFIFTPEQLQGRLKKATDNDMIIPFLCIDDASVHFNNKLWFINLYTATMLDALFDTIREAVNCLLINCPNKKRLLDSLRSYDDHEITIYMGDNGGYHRKSVCIKWFSLPDGHRKYSKTFEDEFSCFVPNDIYFKYRPMRKKYLQDVIDRLDSLSLVHKKKKEGKK